jgi:hypothetical protein
MQKMISSVSARTGKKQFPQVRIFDFDPLSRRKVEFVTLTQINSIEVDVLVSLIADTYFVDTGGPHNAFAFNLSDAPARSQ